MRQSEKRDLSMPRIFFQESGTRSKAEKGTGFWTWTFLAALVCLYPSLSGAGPSPDLDEILNRGGGSSMEKAPISTEAADAPSAEAPVSVTIQSSASVWPAGSEAKVEIRFQLAEGHYINREMTSIQFDPSPGLSFGDPEFPEPKEKHVASLGKVAKIYPHDFSVWVPVRIDATANRGKRSLLFRVRYQACSQKLCLLPETVKRPLLVEITSFVEGASGTSIPAEPAGNKPPEAVGNTGAADESPSEKSSSPAAPVGQSHPDTGLRKEFVFAEDMSAQGKAGLGKTGKEEAPVSIQAVAVPGMAAPGSKTAVEIRFQIAAAHYVNRDLTNVTVKKLSVGLQAGEALFPKPKEKHVQSLGKVARIYQEDFVVRLPVRVAAEATLGMKTLILEVRYQACSEEVCFIPTTKELGVTLEIASPAKVASMALAAPDSGGTGVTSAEDLGSALKRGLLYAYFFVFLGGILASLTPCVYPMIPITVAVIGASSAESRWRGFVLSLFFVLGLALVYALLGVVAGATGSVFGWVLQNPWVVGFVSLVFAALALGMFEFYELAVPPAMANRLNRIGGSGHKGAFLVGMVTGVVASPCVGPMVIGILSWIATAAADPGTSRAASLGLGFSLMFVFALGMGILFVIIGTFSGVLTSLPKSGTWMIRVKHLLGATLFGVAWFFALPLLPPFVPLVLLTLVLLVLAMGELESERQRRAATATMGAVATYLLVIAASLGWPAIFDSGLASATAVQQREAAAVKVEWHHSEESGFQAASELERPVMIDFYADWCAACKELDLYTYADDSVAEFLKEFVSIKIDGTRETPELLDLYKKYGVMGLPTVLFLTAEGKPFPDLTLTGFEKAGPFLDRLRKVKAAVGKEAPNP